MIISKINTKNKKVKPDITYPVIARYVDNSHLVVLFNTVSTGTVLSAVEGRNVGDYDTKWIDVTDERNWTILERGESITLTQN